MLRTNPFHPSAFFGIIMNSNKFAFLSRAFAAVSSLYSLIKAICERDSICRRGERDSVEARREGYASPPIRRVLEIQLGYADRRFGGADNTARHVGFLIAWSSSQKRSCFEINRMRKRGGKVSDEAEQLPKEQTMPPHIKSWQPSRIQTGLRNHPIGRKVSVVGRQRA